MGELADHVRTRDADPSSEGATAGAPTVDRPRRFVVHHHLASSQHYDLRLEIDGVLVSWAVPKGPSRDPRDRRLAVRTADRPIDDFERTMSGPDPGPDRSATWDVGTWQNTSTSDDDRREPVPAVDALDQGRLTFRIDGSKLRGRYTLQRFRDRDEWLLIKQTDDDHPPV